MTEKGQEVKSWAFGYMAYKVAVGYGQGGIRIDWNTVYNF